MNHVCLSQANWTTMKDKTGLGPDQRTRQSTQCPQTVSTRSGLAQAASGQTATESARPQPSRCCPSPRTWHAPCFLTGHTGFEPPLGYVKLHWGWFNFSNTHTHTHTTQHTQHTHNTHTHTPHTQHSHTHTHNTHTHARKSGVSVYMHTFLKTFYSSLVAISGRLTRVKLQQPQVAAKPSPTSACWVFSCFRNPPNSS